MILFALTDLDKHAMLADSVFNNYLVMMIMRWVAVFAISGSFIYYIGYPILKLIMNFFERLLPGYKQRMKERNDDNYEDYLDWVEKKGYEPVIAKEEV